MSEQVMSGQSTQEEIDNAQRIIDSEFEARSPKGVSFYQGIYFGDFDYERLLKLAVLLSGWCMKKEVN